MSLRKQDWVYLAVVRVSPAVFDLPGTVITDGNAASDNTLFLASPTGLGELDETLIYAEWWTDDDYWTYIEKKRARCAEVLVPEMIAPPFLMGCYVGDRRRAAQCRENAPGCEVIVRGSIFFL
jgi:hypothetical protein